MKLCTQKIELIELYDYTLTTGITEICVGLLAVPNGSLFLVKTVVP